MIDTLHGLEELGWVERKVYATKVRRVEYFLAAKYEQHVRRAVAIASREETRPPNVTSSRGPTPLPPIEVLREDCP